jgi:MFS family permease
LTALGAVARAALALPRRWWGGYRESCRDLPAPVWHLAAVAFVSRTGMMVMPFLVLYLGNERGLSPEHATLVLAVVGLAGTAGQFVGGHLADRFGPRPVQLVSLFGAGVAMFVAGATPTTPTLVAGLVALALVSETFRPANAAAIAAFTSAAQRPRAYALHRLAVNFGVTFGPIVGGQLAQLDYDYLFWCNGAVLLIAGALLARLSGRWPRASRAPAPPPDADATDARSPASGPAALDRSPWRDPVLLVFLLSVLPTAVVFMQFQSGLPLELGRDYGFDEGTIGWIFAVNTILIVLFEMPLWRRLAGREPLGLVALGAALTGLGFAATGYGTGLAFACATVCVWTLGEILHASSSFIFVADRAGPNHRGRYMGALGVTNGLAVALGPLLCSATFASGLLWPLCAAFGIASAVVALLLRRALRASTST